MTIHNPAAVSRWGRAFWRDLLERNGSVLIYSLITLLTMDNVLEGPDWDTVLWPIVVLPVALSFLKGMLANLKDAQSGASLLDGPPGPVLADARGVPLPDERGNSILMIAVVVVVVILLLALFTRVL